MHEMGVLYKVVKTAHSVAEKHGIEELKFITLEIGKLTGYVPLFLEKYFPIVIEDFPRLKNAELKIETVNGKAFKIKEIGY